ncbi:MAG: archaeal heat shock protein Hsp14 [Conexivisphaerales archaeon]
MIENLARQLGKEISHKSREVYEVILPPIDMYVDGKDLVVEADLPGFKKESINTSITETTLSITAKREKDQTVTYYWEQRPLRVNRTIILPVKVDVKEGVEPSGKYENGVLTIRLPIMGIRSVKIE